MNDIKTQEECLAAVKLNGLDIQHFTPDQRTPDVIMAAVQQNGRALQYLTPQQRTPDVIKVAIQHGTASFLKALAILREPKNIRHLEESAPEVMAAIYGDRTNERPIGRLTPYKYVDRPIEVALDALNLTPEQRQGLMEQCAAEAPKPPRGG